MSAPLVDTVNYTERNVQQDVSQLLEQLQESMDTLDSNVPSIIRESSDDGQ